MQQHRVICKEINKQLQRMCFDKPFMWCPETASGSKAQSSEELGLPDQGISLKPFQNVAGI